MFRATVPIIRRKHLPMRHLVFVALHRWLSGIPAYQTVIYIDKYQVSHRYGVCSWWWAHSCPKHVEKSNKYIEKNYAPRRFYLQDYTTMHGQQNIKKKLIFPLRPLNISLHRSCAIPKISNVLMFFFFFFHFYCRGVNRPWAENLSTFKIHAHMKWRNCSVTL